MSVGPKTSTPAGFAGRVASAFLTSKLTPIVILASLVLGLFAAWHLPREEEPQIQVPIVDVFASLPGASPEEVENRLTRPLEKLFWEVPDAEYLYSTSAPGNAQWIVRFKVGTRIEDALIRLHQKVQGNADRMPAGAAQPLLKSRTIDDVPILAVTFHSRSQDHLSLRRIAAQFEDVVKSVPMVAETTLIGGTRRSLRVELDPISLAAHGLTVSEIEPAIAAANIALQSGSRSSGNVERAIDAGAFLKDVGDVGRVVVAVRDGATVMLRDVATIRDGSEEPNQYVFHGDRNASELEPAVTLSVAKRPGANAIDVAHAVLVKIETARAAWLPSDVKMTVTRNYGETAAEKSNELLLHMGIAVFGVAILILFFLGWRESLVVLLAIPTTLALTLLVFYLYGYTLNRITLFALIFSIGILVDDAIVVVENIVRHVRRPGAEKRPLKDIALEAVDEVGNPTLLATWAVIAAILPMAFVGGLMGPYMRPIPIGSTAAMLFSVAIAFAITPWAAIRVLKRRTGGGSSAEEKTHDPDHAPDDFFTRLYHRVMEPLLGKPSARWVFLGGIGALLLGSAGLVLLGFVQVKMLPFDNKSEFQIILKTQEGTPLEETARIAREMAAAVQTAPEVSDVQVYVGTAAPFNFNGLVRHYYLRRGPNVGDIQVNLADKAERSDQSHAIAKRIRPLVTAIAERNHATVTVAEVPPGPPVLQSIVAEIYGPDEKDRFELAKAVRSILERTKGVVDVDWFVEADQKRIRYEVDRLKAAQHGITPAQVIQTLDTATRGRPVGLYRLESEREDVPLVIELPRSVQALAGGALSLSMRASDGHLVPLSELVNVVEGTVERARYRKNLMPVTYVTSDVAGAIESPAYAMFAANAEIAKLDARAFGATQSTLPVFHLNVPTSDTEPALKWDGEWHITLEVFRDLGLAFAAVLVLIAMLMVGWFGSYKTPLVVMAAIPFSLVGILPAHWAMGAFFTATSMIGFMAGAGIVVRNSIILVDFIELRRAHGLSLRDAVIEAGAVRFRPMLLTALAVVVGASVILADPIFQGLAISLMFGEIASLLISRMAVPVLYFMSEISRVSKE